MSRAGGFSRRRVYAGSMSHRNDVAPGTLGVEITDDAVAVDYLDGRRVTYAGPPETVAGAVHCAPGKTHDDILEGSGVGRVLLSPGESTELFPGVRAALDGHAVTVESAGAVDGRVFVFEEDEFGERAYELVAEE